jgi:hypothetical protein
MPGGLPLELEVCNGSANTAVTTTSLGTVCTSGAADTMGAFTTLVASAPSDCCWMGVIIFNSGSGVGDNCAVNVAVGASGSEKIIAQQLIGQDSSGTNQQVCYFFPVSIAAGTRISAQSQQVNKTRAITVIVYLFDGAFTMMEGHAGVDSNGFTAASTEGTELIGGTANTKGSFAQLIASTARDYVGIIIALDDLNGTSAAGTFLIDLAQGASGSETVIVPNFGASAENDTVTPQNSGYIPIPIPAGTRIAARCQSSAASNKIGITVYGVYQ